MERAHAETTPPDEVDPGIPCVEVRILWGEHPLQVTHLAPPRSFHLGAAPEPDCDFVLHAVQLGALRAPLVLVDARGAVEIVLLPRADGTLTLPGGAAVPLRDPGAPWQARAHHAIPGAVEVPLPPGAKAIVEVGGLVFEVTHDRAARAFPGRRRGRGALLHVGASLAAHALVLLAAARAMPPLGAQDDGGHETYELYALQVLLEASAERGEEEAVVEPERRAPDGEPPVSCKCGDPHGGAMGEPRAAVTGHRYGVQGHADNPDPHVAREPRSRDTWESSLGPYDGSWGGDPEAPTAVWGRDDSLGDDEASARGSMWGDSVGTAFGVLGMGAGPPRRCETCSSEGRGRDPGRTAPGGPTGTESAAALGGGRPPG